MAKCLEARVTIRSPRALARLAVLTSTGRSPKEIVEEALEQLLAYELQRNAPTSSGSGSLR